MVLAMVHKNLNSRMQELNILHLTSSMQYHQSNGLAESMVKNQFCMVCIASRA